MSDEELALLASKQIRQTIEDLRLQFPDVDFGNFTGLIEVNGKVFYT